MEGLRKYLMGMRGKSNKYTEKDTEKEVEDYNIY